MSDTPSPVAGDAAPDFNLPDQNDVRHQLSDYRGKWVVLFFYPKDSTPGCTTEACSFRDAKDDLTDLGAMVLGMSVGDVKGKAKFANKHELNFPLLADEDHAVAESYGVWGPKKFMGREFLGIKRVSFLIDPDGKIARRWDKVKVKTHDAEVLDALRELQS